MVAMSGSPKLAGSSRFTSQAMLCRFDGVTGAERDGGGGTVGGPGGGGREDSSSESSEKRSSSLSPPGRPAVLDGSMTPPADEGRR